MRVEIRADPPTRVQYFKSEDYLDINWIYNIGPLRKLQHQRMRMGPSSTIVRHQSTSTIRFFVVQFGQISMIRSDLSHEQPAGVRCLSGKRGASLIEVRDIRGFHIRSSTLADSCSLAQYGASRDARFIFLECRGRSSNFVTKFHLHASIQTNIFRWRQRH